MAVRHFAPLYTSIWQDEEFTSLDPVAQALYFTLMSQPNITSVGLLPMTFRRWRRCATWKAEDFDRALAELVAAGFVMVDEHTEELLIRSFIRWDGGINHPLRLKSILKEATAIQSLSLRHFVATELSRLGVVGIGTPEPPPSDPSPLPIGTEVPTVPVLTLGDHQGNQEPGTRRGEPLAETREPPTEFCSLHPNGTDQPCGACAGRRRRHESWLSDRAQRHATEKTQLAQARTACTECNPAGWIEGPDGQPLRRCKHPTPAPPATEERTGT